MSFDNTIRRGQGKDKRKPYYDSRGIDRSCRNHGDCPACIMRRTRWRRLAKLKFVEELSELAKS